MANTLTNLTPDLFAALDTVSRELTGFIPAVSRDSGMERASKDQTVRSFVAPASTASDLTAGQLPADNGDQTIGNKTITISKVRYVPVRWNGEEQMGMNTGPGYNAILRDQFAQAMRTLTNEIEADLAGLYVKASRAVVPSGTTLFDAANYNDVANVRRILVDNGAPISDMHLILNTTAGAALRGNAQYAGANTAGREDILRQGVLLDVHGMSIRESAQVVTHTNGTYDGAADFDAVEPIGETSLSVGITGTGGVLPGDVIHSDAVSNVGIYYVVSTANADVDSGNIDITAPGLLEATVGTGETVLLNASLDRNMAFSRSAIHLVTRAPALPAEGDSAVDRMVIQDPRSGLAFEVSKYLEHRQVKYEIAAAWGFEMIKPEHCALLID